jgi:hypothetical protein
MDAGGWFREQPRGPGVACRLLNSTAMFTSLRMLGGLVVIGVSAVGCATPAPLVRLYPSSPAVVWVSGRAAVTREQGGVRVAVAFDRQDGGRLGLRVEVSNGTEANLEVDPSKFTFTDCRTSNLKSCAPTRNVIDPEAMLAALDFKQANEQADAVNSQVLLGTLAVVSVVGDVAAAAGGHPNANAGLGTVAALGVAQSAEAQSDSTLASIAVQQRIWSDEALRRNTLFPGQGTGGRVYVPIYPEAGVVWLHVRVAEHVFSIPFRQVVTSVSRSAGGPSTEVASAHGDD